MKMFVFRQQTPALPTDHFVPHPTLERIMDLGGHDANPESSGVGIQMFPKE